MLHWRKYRQSRDVISRGPSGSRVPSQVVNVARIYSYFLLPILCVVPASSLSSSLSSSSSLACRCHLRAAPLAATAFIRFECRRSARLLDSMLCSERDAYPVQIRCARLPIARSR